MSRKQHTPGPWRAGDDCGEVNKVIAEDGTIICDASDHGSGVEDAGERAANARMLAAAPEMLEKLKEAAQHGEITEGRYRRWLLDAQRIITKAEGLA